MVTLTFGFQQSLDGHVAHMVLGPPGPAVFRHFAERVRNLAGCAWSERLTSPEQGWRAA